MAYNRYGIYLVFLILIGWAPLKQMIKNYHPISYFSSKAETSIPKDKK